MGATEATGAEKGYRGLAMEGPISRWYAKVARKDLAEYRRLAGLLAGRMAPGASALEVASGPGFLAIELARRGDFRVAGLDISRTFVRMASENARAAGVPVEFRHGNASAMPFEDGTFDLIACRAAFKNFSEPVRALDEMHRVLRPGGAAYIFDLRRDARPEEVDAYVEGLGLGRLDALMTRWTFRRMLIPRAYSADRFREMAAASRFGGASIEPSAIGLEVALRR